MKTDVFAITLCLLCVPSYAQQEIQWVPHSSTNYGIVAAAQQQRDSAEQGAKMNQMMGYFMIGACVLGMMQGSGSSSSNAGSQQNSGSQNGSSPQSSGGGSGFSLNKLLPCIMGALMLYQADQLKKKAAEAYQAQMAAATTTTYLPNVITPPSQPMPPNVAAGLQYINSAGYRVGSNGVTLPNGQVVPASTFGSASSLAALGVSSSAFQAAQALQTKFQQQSGRGLASVSAERPPEK